MLARDGRKWLHRPNLSVLVATEAGRQLCRTVHKHKVWATTAPSPRSQGAYEKATAEDDEDVARGLCRLFTEMGESYMDVIM